MLAKEREIEREIKREKALLTGVCLHHNFFSSTSLFCWDFRLAHTHAPGVFYKMLGSGLKPQLVLWDLDLLTTRIWGWPYAPSLLSVSALLIPWIEMVTFCLSKSPALLRLIWCSMHYAQHRAKF